jgi:hypothetical protein
LRQREVERFAETFQPFGDLFDLFVHIKSVSVRSQK